MRNLHIKHRAVEYWRDTIFRWNLIFFEDGKGASTFSRSLWKYHHWHKSLFNKKFTLKWISSVRREIHKFSILLVSGKLVVLWRWNTWWCNCVDLNSARNISIKFRSNGKSVRSEIYSIGKIPSQLGPAGIEKKLPLNSKVSLHSNLCGNNLWTDPIKVTSWRIERKS